MNYYGILILLCLFALIIYDIAKLKQIQDYGEPKYLPPLVSSYLKRKVMTVLDDIRGIFLNVKIRSPTKLKGMQSTPWVFYPKDCMC